MAILSEDNILDTLNGLKISGYILKGQKSSEYLVIVKLSRKQFVHGQVLLDE
jgi:hypothetical protein